MIVTAYTKLIMDCHREEIANRLDLASNGYFATKPRQASPFSVPDDQFSLTPLVQPLAIGREVLDGHAGEILGAA
jgi:hypothetical protein